MKEKKRILLSLSRKKSNLLLFWNFVFPYIIYVNVSSVYGTSKQMMKEVEKKYGASFMMLLHRDKSKSELSGRKRSGTVGTLSFYIGPQMNEKMLDYVVKKVDGVTDYEAGRDHSVMLCDYELIFQDIGKIVMNMT